MTRTIVSGIILLALAGVGPAAAGECVQRPDGFGGSRTTCDDGTTAITRPNGFGGYRTTIQPPLVIPPMPQPGLHFPPTWEPPQECVTRPTSWGGSKTFCR